MLTHFKYLKYILRHKWYVFIECCKYGLIWQGITHDTSKLLPSEWFSYCKFFYSGAPSTKTGSSIAKRSTPDFDVAWNHHQKSNKHHFQYWILITDDGGVDFNNFGNKFKCLPMPDKYRKEMIADWRGAGKAVGKPDTQLWYIKNYDNIVLHHETRAWVDNELNVHKLG